MSLAVAFLLSASLQAQMQSVAGQPNPMALFDALCIKGAAQFSDGDLSEIDLGALPGPARNVLTRTRGALHHYDEERRVFADTRPPTAWEIPGPIYRAYDSEIYLIPPPAQGGSGDFGNSCSVVWEGEDYLAARRSIVGTAGEQGIQLPSESNDGYGLTIQRVFGHMIVIVSFRGWTAILAAPQPVDVKH